MFTRLPYREHWLLHGKVAESAGRFPRSNILMVEQLIIDTRETGLTSISMSNDGDRGSAKHLT